MLKKTITEGDCLYCSKGYSGMAMTRHLESYEKRKNFYLEMNKKINEKSKEQSNNIVFLLSISSKYYPEYWMFIEVDGGRSKLKAIDNFLRYMA
jgi:hypothetical protein